MRDASRSRPINGGHPSPATYLSPARLPGEFGLVWRSPWAPSPGFHLVFPGSLRGWPTTPVRSLYSYLLFCNWRLFAISHLPVGGAEGIRTPDLISAIDALSQLSYSPMFKNSI